jgi:hypothetical protein
MIADPLGRMSTYFMRTSRVHWLAVVVFSLSIVLIVCAVMSPRPPLHQYHAGGLLPIGINSLFSFFFGFTSTSIFHNLRKLASSDRDAEKLYRWSAFMIQSGAFVGTFVTLILVLVTYP